MTEPFCTITPSRGDRPHLLDFCKYQLSRMNVQPKETFFIDHKPTSSDYDLTLRVKLGIAAAERAGIDICYIIEDDDAYPSDYFQKMNMNGVDFIGSSKTLYYNIQNNSWKEWTHERRSSLFCTGFRISAMKRFSWPPDNTLFLDLPMWRYACKLKYKLLDRSVGIGIKHGIGMTAGVGHRLLMPNKDPDRVLLKSKLDKESYAFYAAI